LKKNKFTKAKLPPKKIRNLGGYFQLEQKESDLRFLMLSQFIEDLLNDKEAIKTEYVKKFFFPHILGDSKIN
jgi:hypothetical protein